MLGQVAVLSIRGEYFDRVLSVLSYLKEKEGTYSGVVSKQDLNIILDACIENGHAAAAVVSKRFLKSFERRIYTLRKKIQFNIFFIHRMLWRMQ